MINNPEAILQFRNTVEAISHVSDEEFHHLAAVMHKKHFDKGEVILGEGQVCRSFYFILTGCIRSFGVEHGKEMNLKFFFEEDIVSNFVSLREEQPSEIYLVAMEDCEVLSCVKAEYLPIFEESVEFKTFLFRFFQQLFLREEQHSNTFKLLSPEERYLYLLNNSPHYLQRIPLTQLATYLGVSRETLTRIRKRLS